MKHQNVSHLLLSVVTLSVLAFLAGCGQPPEQEMAAARQAVQEAADNPDVARYAPDTLSQAEGLLSEMEAAAEAGENDSARSLAQEAVDTAEAAVEEAGTAKSRARQDAESAVAAARSSLEEARNALQDARDVQGIELTFSAARGELASAAEAISAAETRLQDEEFADAENRASDARSTISAVTRRVSKGVQAAIGK